MPFPVAAAIAAGASLAGTAASVANTRSLNQMSRRSMFDQRQWALEDWYRQTEYDSPKAQMERLRAAGLNPNLVYGSGVNQSSPTIRPTDTPKYQPADFSGIGRAAVEGIQAYQDMRINDQQVQNLEAARAKMELDAALRAVEITGKNLDNAKSLATFNTAVETADEQLRNLKTTTDIKVSKEVRDAAMFAPNLQEAFERVANLSVNRDVAKAQLANLRKTGVLQQMEINMRKLGLSYNDSVILRVLAQFAGGKSLPEVVRNLWDQLQKLGGSLMASPRDVIDVK